MKSKKKVITIIIALIIIIAGATFAYFYFCTDMFKTPEELFYKYVGKAAKTEEKYNYQDMLEELKTVQTKSYTGKTKVGIELKSTGKSYTSMKEQAAYNMINGIGLEIQTESNPNEKKASYNIGINYAGKNITELELVKDNDLYGLKSEFLDDKYIAIENKNLKSLVRKLGGTTSGIPDKIESLDMYELLYISKEDQEQIVKTYEKILKENVTSEKFKKVENVIQKINDVDTNTTVYSLAMNEKEFDNLMLKLFEAIKEDELMLNLIVDKVNMYLNANTAMQNYMTNERTKLTKSTLKEGLEEIIDDLKDAEEYADENSVAEFALYVADGKTVRMEFRLDEEIQMAIDFYTADDKQHVVLYSQNNSYSKYSSYYYSSLTSKTKKAELEKIMEMEYKTTKEGEKSKLEGNIIAYEDEEEIVKMSFDITTKGKVGQGKNESQYKINIEADEISVGFTIDSEIEYADNIKIEELNNKNSTILNNMSKTEIEEFFNKVGENIEEKLEDKMEDLGLMNSISSKSIMP